MECDNLCEDGFTDDLYRKLCLHFMNEAVDASITKTTNNML